jgi:SSS family transporter
MTAIDFVVIGLFSALIVFIGLSFSKTSGKDMRSFFSAGGAVPWWINGLSLFMGFVSANTFVAWGSIAYKSGLVAIAIQWMMAIAGLLVGFLIAPYWHRTRALTAAEYISDRLGVRTQKTYSAIYLAIMVFMTGVYIYAVAKLLMVSTNLVLPGCTKEASLYFWIMVLGLTVIIYTTVGGLWAVVVTDTLQFVILTAAALIVVPLAITKVGGLQQFFAAQPTEGFFNLTNHEYTWQFLVAFGLYNFFYLAGQWGFVQRYTSVKTEGEARKVGWLFGGLYLISPIIWMLPPMICRIVNPQLVGLQSEEAYLMISSQVLPAGMLGLLIISLVFATTSSVQGVLNIAAGVITNDLVKPHFPEMTEKQLMRVAKAATFFFGIITMSIAMLVPSMGGATQVVLTMAGLTGCPLYLPLIWVLFSKRHTGMTVLSTTVLSLAITLSLKFLLPLIPGCQGLSRANEMIAGVVVPAVIMLIQEILLRIRQAPTTPYEAFDKIRAAKLAQDVKDVQVITEEAEAENRQGIRMIAIGILFTGLVIGTLGVMAKQGTTTVVTIAAILLALGSWFFYGTMKKPIKK